MIKTSIRKRAAGGTGTLTVLYRDSAGQWAAKVGVPPRGWLRAYASRSQ